MEKSLHLLLQYTISAIDLLFNNNNTLETCCHTNSSEKPSANIDMKNSKGVKNNNMAV